MIVKDNRPKSSTFGQLVEIKLEEKEFIKVVKKISWRLADSYKFGMYDTEDISQEIYIMAIEGLPSWDSSRPLYSFLVAHISNRLNNLKRNQWYRATCPCKLCDKKNNGETEHTDKQYCEKFKRWKSTNSHKANIAAPNTIPDSYDNSSEQDPIGNMCSQELLDYIDEHLPVSLRNTYLKLRANIRITEREKESVCAFLKELLNAR